MLLRHHNACKTPGVGKVLESSLDIPSPVITPNGLCTPEGLGFEPQCLHVCLDTRSKGEAGCAKIIGLSRAYLRVVDAGLRSLPLALERARGLPRTHLAISWNSV